jgi:phosphatidylserine/phosphatidylglycerophosphate/cardiolipin synthase-like enzyme
MKKFYYLIVFSVLVLTSPLIHAQSSDDIDTNIQPNGGSVQIYSGFSPSGSAEKLILNVIAKARTYIYMAAYEYTSHEITTALITAQGRGVDVRIVADYKSNISNKSSPLYDIVAAGALVRLNDHYAIEHNKFMVIDDMYVETGSFNYTVAADKNNAENALVIMGDMTTIINYKNEFVRLWNESDKKLADAGTLSKKKIVVKTPEITKKGVQGAAVKGATALWNGAYWVSGELANTLRAPEDQTKTTPDSDDSQGDDSTE